MTNQKQSRDRLVKLSKFDLFSDATPFGKPITMKRENSGEDAVIFVCGFRSRIGWCGLVGRDAVVYQVLIGHPSLDSVIQSAFRCCEKNVVPETMKVAHWNTQLQQKIKAYTEGVPLEFNDVELKIFSKTSFCAKVLSATRLIGYGSTTSYGELARHVGHPGAARAVGTVMSMNRFPIVIPCHRVLAAGGRLGGYTSPVGIPMKKILLEMEERSLSVTNCP